MGSLTNNWSSDILCGQFNAGFHALKVNSTRLMFSHDYGGNATGTSVKKKTNFAPPEIPMSGNKALRRNIWDQSQYWGGKVTQPLWFGL